MSIPIYVKNSFNPDDPGTLITSRAVESHSVMKGIGVIPSVSYNEFPLEKPADFDRIKRILESYDGITVLWSAREESSGNLRGKFLLKRDGNKEKEFGKKYFREVLYHKIKAEVFGGRTVKGGFYYHDAALLTVCGAGLGNSHADKSKIEEILAGLDVQGGIRKGLYHFPFIKDADFLQFVVRNNDTERVIKSIYNQLKRINIVVYGLRNIGPEFLGCLIERYDEMGLNVIGVADTSGVYAKPGGFSAQELGQIIKKKREGISAADMPLVNGAMHFIGRIPSYFRDVYEMSKGDFVMVDATDDPKMLNTTLKALKLGSRVISVNKLPYAIQPLPYDRKGRNLERIANEKVRQLYKAMLQGQLFNRGTVGADLGIPGTLLRILAQNPAYVTAIGCASGTLGYICTGLDKNNPLSKSIGNAVEQGIAETQPYKDLSGRDVLNKFAILWREIATKYGKSFFDCNFKYESFIQPAIDRYEQKTGTKFRTDDLSDLTGESFIDRMKLLDEPFAELRAELGSDYVFRYVGEISYDPSTRRYSLSVGLKPVNKDSALGSLEGKDNMVIFGINGHPKKSYGIEPGPGAGVQETASAIMHDLEEINRIVRGESTGVNISHKNYKPDDGAKYRPVIRWFGPGGPSIKSRGLCRLPP